MATAVSESSSTVVDMPSAGQSPETQLQAVLDRQHAAIAREGIPGYAQRITALKKLEKFLIENQAELVQVIAQDFAGQRAEIESIQAEVFTIVEESRFARKKLKRWMRAKRVPVGINWAPGKARLHTKPLGVVGVMGTWNYPVQMVLSPMIGAIAAGNHVMLKVSDMSPNVSAYLKEQFSKIYSENYVAVMVGGMDVAVAFSQLAFDKICFTGSTKVGKLVMQAASKNLVPVTLELGGKSPALFAPDYTPGKHTKRMMRGKLYNAGQTCIAPDYVLVTEQQRDELVQDIQKQASSLYPEFVGNSDYTAIQNPRHFERMQALLDDAEAKGARVIPASESHQQADSASQVMPPMLVLDVTEDMLVMQEEIFGPILPIKTYQNINEAVGYINGRDRPLALYFFGKSKDQTQLVIESTTFGGGCVNETIFHQPQLQLPFGGVGNSGMGAYHGKWGFDEFSKTSGVFYQSRWTLMDKLTAPYGKLMRTMLKFLIGKPPKID